MYEAKTKIRITKTVTELYKSLYMLLRQYNYQKITMEALCEETQISRATFYSHFNNKYDLLSQWLIALISSNISREDSYDKIKKTVNQLIIENKRVFRNIMNDADCDTLAELYEVARFILYSIIKDNADEKMGAKDIVWDSFFVGGFVYYLSLQLSNDDISDISLMNIHFYTLVKMFQEA